ncbi:hypothetical protein LB518_13755 [Mesorhizobium sp. BR1-1-16]|uniref:hypothetical protein n=1 Tax=Mesorhizobium sp. BR1-1-16 TaxID=2876653 RepID=UPI001CCB5EB1|nr:hypothetical protein [Mesorhizobium sp. BR1-1-16]MBZ9937365.1 hypothetical protein [Mesorhizobium sp. BR1-1-16]
MLKSALVAVSLAVGSLALTAGAASAAPVGNAPVIQVAGPGNHYDHGWRGPGWQRHHSARRVCSPVFRTVRVHGHHGWHVTKVKVGERCHVVRRGW